MGAMNEEVAPFSAEAYRGFSLLAGTCAAALVNEPTAGIVKGVQRVAEATGDPRFNGVRANEALLQRYYDRIFVSSSPLFVPLSESCVRASWDDGGTIRYGVASSRWSDHVLGCYRAVGFDWTALGGFEPAMRQLRPDSLASELAFLSFLAASAAYLPASDAAASRRSEELLVQFARQHAGAWFGAAADALRRTDDDFYAGVCALAAKAVDVLAA